MSDRLAYSVEGAAEAVSVSPQTIRRALRSTDPKVFPPPLRAKRAGSEAKPSFRILASELVRWVNSWPDA